MSGCIPGERRDVSNEELTRVLADRDVQSVVKSILYSWRFRLPEDDLESCGRVAVWRALQRHRTGWGQKFTGTLYKYVQWHCRDAYRRHRREELKWQVPGEYPRLVARRLSERAGLNLDRDHLLECVALVKKPWMRDVLVGRLVEQRSFREMGRAIGLTHEAVRRRYRKAEAALVKVLARDRAKLNAPGETA